MRRQQALVPRAAVRGMAIARQIVRWVCEYLV